MPKLANLRFRDLIALLQQAGFVKIRQEGSHVAFRGPGGEVAIVPNHGAKVIPLGTVLSILRQARIAKPEAIKFFK